MRDIFRILKDGSDALREMGLDEAADQMLGIAEEALTSCEDWLHSKLHYALDEAEAALATHQSRKDGCVVPRRAIRTLDLEEMLATVTTPWYGETYKSISEDTVTYLPDFVASATVRSIDDARELRKRNNFTVLGKLKKV